MPIDKTEYVSIDDVAKVLEEASQCATLSEGIKHARSRLSNMKRFARSVDWRNCDSVQVLPT